MQNLSANVGAALVLFAGLWGTSAFAQNTADAIDAHLVAARDAAGFDFTGTLARLCARIARARRAPDQIRSSSRAACCWRECDGAQAPRCAWPIGHGPASQTGRRRSD